MRTIINYIRSCFCQHDWELIYDVVVKGIYDDYHCKTYRCKKCGYSKQYKSN